MSKFRFGVLLVVVLGLSLAVAGVRSAANSEATTGESPEFEYIGKLAFGPEGVVFAADTQDVSITALHLGDALAGGVPGTQDVPAIDQKVAGLLGIDAADLLITDMVVDPRSRNTWLSVMRGMGADAMPVLLRVDGAGEIEVVSFEGVRYTRIGVPNPPPAATPLELVGGRSIPVPNYPDAVDPAGLIGVQTITHMAFVEGNLFVSGLSNEEFASKMRVIPYPFRVADAGTSVEIYHGSHGQLETFSPVFTFVPYEIDGEPSIVASYLCTPLVKFPIAALEPGSKIQGTTIAEFGNRNRPIDMIVYEKDGEDFILLSNNQRGVMKVPTAPFGAADAIAEAIPDTAGVPFETIAALEGVQQLDKLDDAQAMLLVAAAGGGLNLEAAALP
ncbi:MAG: hypothetical protein OXG72_16995 [Acidobacteria bacterium]|nr:hypothetical protein [Acidobacteriota bacterium]